MINETDSLLWDVATCLPLWQDFEFVVQNSDLANYGAFGFESSDWTKIGWIKGSSKVKSK